MRTSRAPCVAAEDIDVACTTDSAYDDHRAASESLRHALATASPGEDASFWVMVSIAQSLVALTKRSVGQ